MEDRDLPTIYVKGEKFLLKIFQELEPFNFVHGFSQLSPLQHVLEMSIGLWFMLVKGRDLTEISGTNPKLFPLVDANLWLAIVERRSGFVESWSWMINR